MKWIHMILLPVLVISCGKSSSGSGSGQASATKQLVTVPEVDDFLAEINDYRSAYLGQSSIDNVIFEYTDTDNGNLEAPARGYCDKSGTTPRVVLYRPDWIGSYAADSTMKRSAIYHLIGHCVFNKNHNDQMEYDGMTGNPTSAKSYMHSNFGYQLFPNYYGGLSSQRIINLQREFFNYYGPL